MRIPRPPDRASPVEVIEHQARMRELVEQGIDINGKHYDLVLATGACKHGQDVDGRGQPYDLILPESSLKGNSPGPGEYVWDTTHLGFNAWSERCRVRLSYRYFQKRLA